LSMPCNTARNAVMWCHLRICKGPPCPTLLLPVAGN
jgi:hypothetical protein